MMVALLRHRGTMACDSERLNILVNTPTSWSAQVRSTLPSTPFGPQLTCCSQVLAPASPGVPGGWERCCWSTEETAQLCQGFLLQSKRRCYLILLPAKYQRKWWWVWTLCSWWCSVVRATPAAGCCWWGSFCSLDASPQLCPCSASSGESEHLRSSKVFGLDRFLSYNFTQSLRSSG